MLPNTNNNNSVIQLSVSTAGAKLSKCAQLQIPGETRTCLINNENQSKTSTTAELKVNFGSAIFDQKDFFEENVDKLKNYAQIMNRHQIKIKSLSTSDIVQSQIDSNEVSSLSSWNKKYLSDCDLADYYKFNTSDKKCIKDYITYSCSTLAICGDTIYSSQLPSPQAQSFRQLNSLIFSDLDLAKSLNKKIINICIKRRLVEFSKVINQATLSQNEIDNIGKISSHIIKPLKMTYDYQPDEQLSAGEIFINVVNYEHNEVKFTKRDKEKFVLNWLQTVEPAGILEPN